MGRNDYVIAILLGLALLLSGASVVLANNADLDGDGWTVAEGDCCDDPMICPMALAINPGAFEIIGNGLDDDCDPTTSDAVPVPDCGSVEHFNNVTPEEMAQAMELCQETTENPPPAERKWGVISAEFVNADGSPLSAAQLDDIQNWQTGVLEGYGHNVVPYVGGTMAGMSTGDMSDRTYDISTSYGRDGTLPIPLQPGQDCDGNDCPTGSGANDAVNLRLTIRVPTNADSFKYRFRFFSLEFWDYSCTQYNDHHLALLTSGAAGIPADRNIAFDHQLNPVSVNSTTITVCNPHPTLACRTCPHGIGDLDGTGMAPTWPSDVRGGGTVWLETTAPVVPGETIVLELMVFDVSDNIFDSLVLLDGFEWTTVNDHDKDGIGTYNGDNCPSVFNPNQEDQDGDGIGDVCDACPEDADNDVDGDGICGDVDNCPMVPNSDQADADNDSLGDVCDNCPDDFNLGQADADSDGLGDVCDACQNDADNDEDSDGVCGDVDNCPADANTDQADSDGNGIGDVCDTTAIINLSARAKSGKVTITWSHKGSVSYNIYRSVGGGNYELLANTTSTYSTYLDALVTNGTEHCYIVKGVNVQGLETPDSNATCATPTERRRRR